MGKGIRYPLFQLSYIRITALKDDYFACFPCLDPMAGLLSQVPLDKGYSLWLLLVLEKSEKKLPDTMHNYLVLYLV